MIGFKPFPIVFVDLQMCERHVCAPRCPIEAYDLCEIKGET